MILPKLAKALAAAALVATVPAFAQSPQEALDARHDRALAAGYKSLFLCSAIGNAERRRDRRTAESVERWELAGIQRPLDSIVADLPHRIWRDAGGSLRQVTVEWADDMPPRLARHRRDEGCSIAPVGAAISEPDGVLPEVPPPTTEGYPAVEDNRRRDDVARMGFSADYGEGTRTTAVLIQRDGLAVGEAYAADFGPGVPQRTWSVAKSIAATLVGAAVQRGEADVRASAGLGAADDDPRRAITVDHLLRMASGRYSDTPGNSTDPLYFGGSTVGETAAHWPLIRPPGTAFRYANNDTLMAIDTIAPTFAAHPPAEFFAKLGMNSTIAETDGQGDYILSSQVWSTARDLARLGQLYLDDGVWKGERILPEGWREYVSTPSGPQPDGPMGYGAGFWLLDNSEGVPADTFAALGNRGQFVVIVPSRNLVIVRRGEDPAGTRFDIAGFTRDALAALGD